jgi:hypothetical protein
MRSAALALALVAGALGGTRLVETATRTAPVDPRAPTATVASHVRVLGGPPDGVDELNHEDIAAVAARWVGTMWSRLANEMPFGWLDRVADITSDDLEAGLRSARPWSSDAEVLSASVEVVGVHPEAHDRRTVTVVCVVHRRTASGVENLPCTTTVTLAIAQDGRLAVVAVR